MQRRTKSNFWDEAWPQLPKKSGKNNRKQLTCIKKVEPVQYANLYSNKILAYTLILCPVCSSNTTLYNILLANECIFFVISVHSSLKIPTVSLFGIVLKLQNLNFCIMLKMLICTKIKLWKHIQNCMLELKSSSHYQNLKLLEISANFYSNSYTFQLFYHRLQRI